MDRTPEQWLSLLARRLDQRFLKDATYPGDEYPGISRLRRYAHGRPDLPEMGQNTKETWKKFQKKARRDYGGLAVTSLLGRVRFNGIRVGTSTTPALIEARRILRDNRAPLQIAQALRDMVETRWGYLVVGLGADGRAVITREAPEQFIAATDPLRPWKAVAAMKVWRGDDDRDYALVWTPGLLSRYARPTRTLSGTLAYGADSGDWALVADEPFDGDPPVVVLELDRAFLEEHIDLIDAIVLGKLNRLVITAMQAFRQRALKKTGDAGEIEAKDAAGNDVDLAKVFEAAPGAMWDLPEGVDIWESKPAELAPLIAGEKQDAIDFSAQTGTPLSALVPDGQNQSAEGASTAKEGQIDRARAITDAVSPALAVLVVYALRAEGIDLGGDTVEVLWVPPEHVSLAEKYDAATKARAAGRARRGIFRDILGMTPDQIAEEERDLATEQLEALALTGGGQGG